MTKVLQLGVALSFILYLCYIRLFRSFYDIDFSSPNIQKFFFIFVVIFVLTFSLTLMLAWTIYSENFLLNTNKTQSKFKTITLRIANVINIPLLYINNSQITLYIKIFDFVGPLVQQYLVLFAKKFLESVNVRRILYAGIVFPRIIVILILIIELYFSHLKIYYYSLLLLIIPLIMQFLVFILKDLGPRLYPVFCDHLIFTKVAMSPNNENDLFFINITLKPEYSFMDLDAFMHELYYPMLYLPATLESDFLPKYNKLRQSTLFFYFFVQTLCWGYVLIVYFL